MSTASRILMLGLDAAECDLVLELAGKDRMPTLAGLLEGGAFGRLRSPADLYAGGVWPSFYTGTDVPSHGVFHNKLWRPETMRVDVPSEKWLDARPFWEPVAEAGIPVCIVDVPMLIGRPTDLNGIYIGGWGTHDLISKGSWPPALWRDAGETTRPTPHAAGGIRLSVATLTKAARRSAAADHRSIVRRLHRSDGSSRELSGQPTTTPFATNWQRSSAGFGIGTRVYRSPGRSSGPIGTRRPTHRTGVSFRTLSCRGTARLPRRPNSS